jgi:ABC-type transporter Mla maintaining outer membrane lipid asymmetry permease subunit MlaE
MPLQPGDYFGQLAASLRWQDFALLALKTCSYGCVIAVTTCYYGLALPLRLEQVASVTTDAVVQAILLCTLLDALFIIVYLLM